MVDFEVLFLIWFTDLHVFCNCGYEAQVKFKSILFLLAFTFHLSEMLTLSPLSGIEVQNQDLYYRLNVRL